ncbi:hypothetical protein ACN26Y_21750 [Micromonospora sp. WMMD558]|uniref:hypothetical protein n=1 Tax=unclassified Micromonospora TaxID=2617518 RepID=UPI0012B48202|nr:hypothetical protein [Micromonospora sp. WMMC415]QGN48663.1 hypothetical protein GKC29_18760 [Micromonospora sp. WMMC415]
MEDLLASRWRGQPGRKEVWYTTITDPATGTGVWLHHELVAPTDDATPYAHGLVGVFPPDGRPVLRHLPRAPWRPDGAVFASGDVRMTRDRFTGHVDDVSWDVSWRDGGRPIYTFPRWAWHRELLPAAQVVPAPRALHHGEVRYGDRVVRLTDAPGATGRIFGHGMARRWSWLHADLGGGDVLEIVAAVARRRGWRHLPVLPFVRLRIDGVDWPGGDPLLAALRFRGVLALPEWRVRGRHGDRRLSVTVRQHADRTLSVPYTDPDGSRCVCHNSERADAEILLETRAGGGDWRPERRWRLHGTAHAEVGLR